MIKVPYKHKASGKDYVVINFKCVDKSTDKIVILYTDNEGGIYTRIPEQFYEKFELVDLHTESDITSENFVKQALKTESNDIEVLRSRLSDPKIIRLLHAVMGLTTETGELMDALKRHIFYGTPLDIKNLKEEGGDTQWYIAILCDVLGTTLDELMTMNIEKLKKRYPEKFTEKDALNRDTNKELNHIK